VPPATRIGMERAEVCSAASRVIDRGFQPMKEASGSEAAGRESSTVVGGYALDVEDSGRRAGEPAMTTAEAAAPCVLRSLEDTLQAVLMDAEKEMELLGHDFEGLARETSRVLDAAGVIVGCAEGERMASVLPRVERLGSAAREFISQRLGATEGILDTVKAEAGLLEQLAHLTRGQKGIVKETEMLRVLTNIEVARLGEVGASFQYLADELDDFSRSVAESTNELTSHTDERRKAVQETRRALAVELPEMRQEFARILESLEDALSVVHTTLGQMFETPVRFKGCVEEVAGQVAGVVAAIQAHDITRQQIEHVKESLGMIAAGLEDQGASRSALRAGLTIQNYQLRNVRETVDGWQAQIRTCLHGIAEIAASEIMSLSSVMRDQESALSTQLMRIESLEGECEAGDAKVQSSFAGISGLMQLVSEHLARSKSVRDRLQLLMFNSIIEASHLGTQADGILEISTSIKRISGVWGEITSRSEETTQEIGTLVEQSRSTLATFSEGSYADLREARNQTKGGLEILREAAQCADHRGQEIEAAVQGLQARIVEIGGRGDRLEAGFRRLEGVLETMDRARQELDAEGPHESFDTRAVERQFGASYTTEMERAVLRAALEGGPLPAAQQSFAGNNVELF
jgi:ABC-type transporter Mla subunit MlaD